MDQSSPGRSFANSHAAYERACHLIPGGVNSPARAFGGVGGKPLFIDRAQGQYLWDIDGHRYLDYIGSWGPMILGHRHPEVMEAILKAVERGTSFGAPTERESQLAEQIIEAVPSIEKVRLVSSGTEATMSAIRLAAQLPAAPKSSSSLETTMATLTRCSSLLAPPLQRSVFRLSRCNLGNQPRYDRSRVQRPGLAPKRFS